jgi:hypothetical protein
MVACADLPSMAVLGSVPVGGSGLVQVGCLALGGDAAETPVPPAWLHVVLSTATGKLAELVVLHLPEMQATHSLRFTVPSAIRAAHYDVRSASLYLLCPGPFPKLFRVQMRGGEPLAPPGQGDAMAPGWGGALPILLPFPETRQIVILADASAEAYPSHRTPPPLRVCRLRMGAPLESAAQACATVPGRYGAEDATAAAADAAAGALYIGCRSGALLRVRLAPLRVDVLIRPTLSTVSAALFRPSDGALCTRRSPQLARTPALRACP